MTSSPDTNANLKTTSTDVAASAKPVQLRFANVFKCVLPLALLLLIAAWLWVLYGNEQMLSDLLEPPLVEAHGIVLMNGAPLGHAEVTTVPLRKSLTGAFGMTDAKGRFTLRTLSRTRSLPGAYPGQHKVGVVAYQPTQQAFGSPTARTPMQFRNPNQSPLTITVSSSPDQSQEIRIELEGELAPVSATPESTRVSEVLGEFDLNKNGKLEANEIPRDGAAAYLANADANGDSSVDEIELLNSIRQHPQPATSADNMMQVGAGFIVGHIFNAHDQNEDGVLDKEEVAKMPAENREHARIAKADLNNDCVIEREELTATVQDE